MGIFGACRCHELARMCLEDLKDLRELYLVRIPVTKTKVERSFTVSGKYYEIVKRYVNERPVGCRLERLFLVYRHNTCLRQVIGKNTISKMPKRIAEFLGLEDVKAYSGHSFRRTSATLLANGGGDLLAIKRQGGWKSSTVAERYLEESVRTKKKNEALITGAFEKEKNRVEKNELEKTEKVVDEKELSWDKSELDGILWEEEMDFVFEEESCDIENSRESEEMDSDSKLVEDYVPEKKLDICRSPLVGKKKVIMQSPVLEKRKKMLNCVQNKQSEMGSAINISNCSHLVLHLSK